MMNSFWKSSGILLGISLGAIAPLPNSNSTLQIVTAQPSQALLELGLTRATIDQNDRAIAPNTASQDTVQDTVTTPSLWWAKEQFGGDLLSHWLAYPAQQNGDSGRIDLQVKRQNWNSLDYIQQYEFVHHFGTDAMDRGYNLRVFNEQKQLLATYTCDFSAIPTQCQIDLDANSKSMIRGGSQFGMMR
ncbi:hypothetical protein DSM107010_58050 [Chroococcidiopsis cubana SAG 39.79]|uniref:Uncharacterized protein n=2 Tax=Chroococcidiopsis TaxID=54298 RepID=A0AB37UC99_9CYAN|nr:hypothetical protein DSM107010_58050 [Chroococcidiopsis cubana SAG 39.79]